MQWAHKDEGQGQGWNAWLPPSYRLDVGYEEEAPTKLAEIRKGLAWSLQVGDLNRGARFWVRALDGYMDLKYGMAEEEQSAFVYILYDLVTWPALDLSLQAKWAQVLERLLKKSTHIKTLELPWRPLYNILTKNYFTGMRESHYRGQAIEAYHASALKKLILRARKFFPPQAFRELSEELCPLWCPHDYEAVFQAQTMFSLFLPNSALSQESPRQHDFLKDVFTKWEWIDKSSDWDTQWLSVVSRLAKTAWKSGRCHDWNAYIPRLFTHFLRMLDVSLGGASKLPKIHNTKFPRSYRVFLPHDNNQRFKYMTKTIVYLLSGSYMNTTPQSESEEGAVFAHLQKLIAAIQSYYYPSNSGAWTDRLAQFLSSLCRAYAKRVGKEKLLDCSVPVEHRLTSASHESFVEAIKDILRQALYSKGRSMPHAAKQSIGYLAHVTPEQTFSVVEERIFTALDTLTATHQTSNVMEALSVMAYPLLARGHYPSGIKHLEPLLRLTLPGIDPNDSKKTLNTLSFFYAVFSFVPILADSDGTPKSEDDDTAKRASSMLLEWVPQFFDQVFNYLQHMEQPTKKKDWSSAAFTKIFKDTFKLFFMHMSPDVYKTYLTKLSRYVTNTIQPNATQEMGHICMGACLANPEAALNTLIPLFLNKLVKKDKSDASNKLRKKADSEMQWYLSMMSYVVKSGGAALLSHLPQIRIVLQLTIDASRKELCKLSSKLLKNVLQSLTTYYPIDYRFVGTDEWESSEFKQTHWKVWGKKTPIADLKPIWHEPSEAEVEHAEQLAEDFLEQSLSRLNILIADPQSSQVKKEKTWRSLKQIGAILKGVATMLPEEEGIGRDEDDEEEPKSGLVPLKTSKTVAVMPSSIKSRLNGTRARIGQALHSLCLARMEHYQDDTSTINQLCKVYDVYLNYRGVSFSKFRWEEHSYRSLKHKYIDIASPPSHKKPLFRHLLMERLHLQHLRRLREREWNVPYTTLVKDMLRDLFALSMHSYQQVRSNAQQTLHSAMKHFPFAKHEFLPVIISKLSQSSDKDKEKEGEDPEKRKKRREEQVTGCIHLLLNKSLLRSISRDWKYLAPFMQSISRTFVHDNDQIQTQAYKLFVAFSIATYRISITTPDPHPHMISAPGMVVELSEANVESARKDHEWRQEKNAQSYQNALHSLLLLAKDSSLHWRYQVILSTCLLFLLGDYPRPSLDMVKWFLHGLTSQVEPMRRLSRKAISIILKIFKQPLGGKKVVASPSAASQDKAFEPLSSEEWIPSIIAEKNYSGWQRDSRSDSNVSGPTALIDEEAEEERQNVISLLKQFFLNDTIFLRSFLSYTAHDHSIRSDDASFENMQRKLFKSLKNRLSSLGGLIGSVLSGSGSGGGGIEGLFGGDAMMQQAAEEILRHLLRPRKRWPYVATNVPASHGHSFDVQNGQLFKGLFQLLNTNGELFEAIKPHLDELVPDETTSTTTTGIDTEKNQCAVGEAISGMIRAANKHNDNRFVNERMWPFVLSLLDRVIRFAPADCMPHWLMALRFAVYNTSARALAPLSRFLFLTQLEERPGSLFEGISSAKEEVEDAETEKFASSGGNIFRSLVHSKSLQFAQVLLCELSWRSPAHCHRLMDAISAKPAVLSHSFKQVRQELGHCMLLIFRNLWQNPLVNTALVGSTVHEPLFTFLKALLSRLDVWENQLSGSDEEKEKKKEGEEAMTIEAIQEHCSKLRESLLNWCYSTVHKGFAESVKPYLNDFLPALFQMHKDVNRETAGQAKQCSALVAQVLFYEKDVREAMLDTIFSLPALHTNQWHVRASLLPFLQILAFNHTFLLEKERHRQLQSVITELLCDPQVEVRELASISLASMIKTADLHTITSLHSAFLQILGKPQRQRRQSKKKTENEEEQQRRRHGAALGLCALIQSSPYDVPQWMPQVLVGAAAYENDANAFVRDSLKKTFAEFWRTHSDVWHLHEHLFEAEQLEAIRQLARTPSSYYL